MADDWQKPADPIELAKLNKAEKVAQEKRSAQAGHVWDMAQPIPETPAERVPEIVVAADGDDAGRKAANPLVQTRSYQYFSKVLVLAHLVTEPTPFTKMVVTY